MPRAFLNIALLATLVALTHGNPHPLVTEHNYRNTSCGYSYESDGCPNGRVCWFVMEPGAGAPALCSMRRAMEEGNPMMATVEMAAGSWRESVSSRTVRRCPSTKCVGGPIGQQCAVTQAGPRCSECARGHYSSAAGQACLPCSGNEVVVIVAALLAVVAAAILIMTLLQYWSTVQEAKQPRTARIYAILSVFSASFAIRLRIIISLVQVMRGVAFGAQLRVPSSLRAILDAFAFIDLNVPEVLPLRCVIQDTSFFIVKLVGATIVPLGVIAMLGLFALLARRCSASFVGYTCAASAFLILYVCYNRAATLIFVFFQCDTLSGPGESGLRFLLADTTIDCDSSIYAGWTAYTIAMALVWPVGVPAVLAGMLMRERRALRDQRGLAAFDPTHFKQHAVAVWVLISPYKPKRFFFEVFEFVRKASLVFLPLFMVPGSANQHTLVIVILVIWWMVMALLHPCAVTDDIQSTYPSPPLAELSRSRDDPALFAGTTAWATPFSRTLRMRSSFGFSPQPRSGSRPRAAARRRTTALASLSCLFSVWTNCARMLWALLWCHRCNCLGLTSWPRHRVVFGSPCFGSPPRDASELQEGRRQDLQLLQFLSWRLVAASRPRQPESGRGVSDDCGSR